MNVEELIARVRAEEADSIGCVLIKAADRDALIDRMRGFLAAVSIFDSVEKAQAARIAELEARIAETDAAAKEWCAQIADAEASIEGIAQRIAAAIRGRA